MKVINKAEFEQITKEGVVLVDLLAPVLEELAEDMKGKAEIVKVDVDQEGDLAMKFGIMSVPTMIVFKNGEAVKQISGYQPKTQLANILNQLL